MAGPKKYLMFISYVGSAFRGSQIQLLKQSGASVITVQGVLEKGIQNEFKIEGDRPVCVHLASRTDKGVHALRAAVVAIIPPFKNLFMKPENLKHRLNIYFRDSKNIRILDVYSVPDSFKLSKLETEKTYLYRVALLKKEFLETHKKDLPVFEFERTYFADHKLFDLERAIKAAKLFEGKRDFGAILGRPSKNTRSTVCNIKSFTIEKAQSLMPFDTVSQRFNFYHFICKGDRFLYCMVRRLVSLALGVGYGIINFEDIQKLFDEPLPSSWPTKGVKVVPGYGLYLVNVHFNMENFTQKEDHFFENSIIEDQIKDFN